MITKYVPGHVLAWESVASAPVQASGLVRFRALSATETELELTLRFAPTELPLAHALAALARPTGTRRVARALRDAPARIARWAEQRQAALPEE